jgi:general secretion pathway protein L
LPAERVLQRTIDLPLAAAENLREVLGFEMDRHTPFRAEDVAFDYCIAARDRAGQRLLVDLAVAPRALVDDVVRQAAALGLPADRVGVAGDDGGRFDLLAADRRLGGGRRTRRLTAALAAAAVLLLVAAALLPLQRQQDVLAAYESRLADSRQKAAEAEALKHRLADSLGRNQFLASRRRATPLVETLLNELTQRLADDTWLVQLRIADKDLSIAGYAPTASALIPVLEDSDYFADVRFSSPVMTDPRANRERFNLAAKITPPGG